MVIAAQAFTEKDVGELKPGSLFLFRQQWAFMGERQSQDLEGERKEKVLVLLQGERAGLIVRAAEGVSTYLTLAEPFGWFAAIEPGVLPQADGQLPGSLVISPSGLVIVGGEKDHWGDIDHFAFLLKGGEQVQPPSDRSKRFLNWSVELCRVEMPYVSLGRILDVAAS
jgi:hypothetical protein